ncbi:YtxH domain-containing protein [Lentibacillus sp.]|uniref:YtxH domain-containing protein n=1 Tax=Lentibacillus sp. TaxID=1925746 RepID=UPI002B4B186F|nr:YtxH domain-containing protein [Lentibacillus sp.]HLS09430.1 YtxH domain-containing protein [Lentibacillus sp.]
MGNSDNNNNSKDFMVGALIGAIAGSVIALLWAPKPGKELRGNINEGALQLKDRAGEWKETAYEKGSDWKDTAYQKGSELKEKAYLKGSDLKTKAVDTTSKLSQRTQEKTQELTRNLQDKWNGNDSKSKQAAAEAIGEAAAEAEKTETK